MKEWVIYPFLPKLYVLSFEKGRRYAGRIMRYLAEKIIIVRPFKKMELDFSVPLITDSEGYYILGEIEEDKIVPYFDIEEFKSLKNNVNIITLVRKVAEKQKQSVKKQMLQLNTAIQNTSELMSEQVEKIITSINTNFVDAVTLVRTSLEKEKIVQELKSQLKEQIETEAKEAEAET